MCCIPMPRNPIQHINQHVHNPNPTIHEREIREWQKVKPFRRWKRNKFVPGWQGGERGQMQLPLTPRKMNMNNPPSHFIGSVWHHAIQPCHGRVEWTRRHVHSLERAVRSGGGQLRRCLPDKSNQQEIESCRVRNDVTSTLHIFPRKCVAPWI